MSHTRLWLAAGIIAIVIAIGFAFSVPHTTRDTVSKSASEPVASTPLVTLHDSYKKGSHTISGSLEAPDACGSVTPEAALMGEASSTQHIQIALTVPPTTGVCLEIPTVIKFSTTLVAPADLPITVVVNGVVASTTAS